MKRYSLFAIIAILLAVSIPAKAQDTPPCTSVGGTFMINFIDQTTAVAALTGDLNGAVRGMIVSSTPGDKGELKLTLEHAITTESGDSLHTSDQATLTPVEDGVFFMRQVQTISSGSGKYANATGTLNEYGAVDMTLGQGVLRYSGQICTGSSS